jgi:predicted ATP-dependent endonuclease of OLD family
MNIKLNRLKIENFKGIKSFEVELDGENACIKAENGDF